ncbi:autoinducer binding domain-containing protein [Salmonella enterica subsp. enterica serovar Uganda]
MQENDFFTWRRAMLLRFQEMAAAEDVYTELQYQTQRLEFDYYALCVRHPVPFTRPKISLRTTYPQAWVTHYQSENYFAIDPVLKPENFRQGHLHWDDVLFHEAQAMQAGAAGYLSKGAAPQEVVSAIRSVYSGQRYIASDIAQQMALSQIEPAKTETPFASLSERELQIMLMITKGQKVNEISEQLNLSPKTVNSYRYRMFSKLNIHGDVELTHLAIRHGLCNAETLTSQ